MKKSISILTVAIASLSAHADPVALSVYLCPQGAENSATRFLAHNLTAEDATVFGFEDDVHRPLQLVIAAPSGEVTLSTATRDIALGHARVLPSLKDLCQNYAIDPDPSLEFSTSVTHGIPLPALDPSLFGRLVRSETARIQISQSDSDITRLIGSRTQVFRDGKWQ